MYTSCSLFDACRYLRQSFAWLSREKLPLKQVKLQYYVLQYLIVTHLPSGLYTCPSCQATEVFFVLLRQVHQQMIPPHFPTAKRKREAAKKKEIYNSPQKYSISFIRAVKHAQRQWWYNLFLEFNMCGVHREPRRKLLTISVFFKPSYRPSKHLLAFKPFQLCALVLPLWSGFHNWSLLTQTFSLAQF